MRVYCRQLSDGNWLDDHLLVELSTGQNLQKNTEPEDRGQRTCCHADLFKVNNIASSWSRLVCMKKLSVSYREQQNKLFDSQHIRIHTKAQFVSLSLVMWTDFGTTWLENTH